MINKKKNTFVIADDHEIIRSALHDLMRQASSGTGEAYELVAFAENGLETIALIKAHKPDLLFLDVSMPLASGAEIILDIRRWSPETRIIVFTGVTAAGLIAGIVESGVDGLFSKAAPVTAILEKLPVIMRGKRYIAPEFLDVIQQGQQAATLTERERQIMNMIVSGKTNKEIARALNISPKTVDKHRTSLMSKLGVHSVAELMTRALKDGLIDPA